jgi:phosphatidylglycerol:prolipoprotein diacylglycerol transferase
VTIGMDPNIGNVGSFAVEWHGLLMALAIVFGVAFALYLAHRDNFPTEHILPAVIWAVIGGLIGSRMTHVIDEWDWYCEHPGEILSLWEGGLGWYGGLIGGVLAGWIYLRVKHVSVGRHLDFAAPAVMLGLAIGRIGCTINGDAPGTSTSLPWGLTYTHPDAFSPLGVSTHPAPVYEIMWLIIVVGVLLWLRKRIKPEWSLFFSMLALYSFGRFFISWVRDEPEVLGPLHQSHIISIVLFAIAVSILLLRRVHLESTSDSESEGASNASGYPQR